MKSAARLAILVSFFAALALSSAFAVDPADVERIGKAVTATDWTWVNDRKPANGGTIKFLRDGSIIKSWGGANAWHWSISGPYTIQLQQTGQKVKARDATTLINFNATFSQFMGSDFGGGGGINGGPASPEVVAAQKRTSASDVPKHAPASPVPSSPAPEPPPEPAITTTELAAQNQLEIVAARGPSISEAVLAPLNVRIADIRPLITVLRDNILDEQAQKPVAIPGAYQAAVQLCDGWLKSLTERDQYTSSYQQARPPTHDMESGKIEHLKPRDFLMYDRELDDALKYKEQDAQLGSFFDDAKKKLWSDRCVAINGYLANLYNRFRTLRRQPMTPQQ